MNYPEHEKLKKVQKESQAVGEFLEWLRGEKGYEIARWNRDDFDEEDDRLVPVHISIEKLLAEFFNIDTNKLEEEKRAMLAQLQ